MEKSFRTLRGFLAGTEREEDTFFAYSAREYLLSRTESQSLPIQPHRTSMQGNSSLVVRRLQWYTVAKRFARRNLAGWILPMGESTPATPTPDTQLFRDVFNASPIGIAVENLEGRPLFVNPAFCSMLGFSEEELRNKHCVDFSPPEDAQKDWALFQQLKAGSIDHYQLEKRYFRRDGSLVWGSLSISLLKSSASPLVLAMVEDITDKKKAEEARFRHAAVVESSEDAIASGTLDGIIVSWNAGAQQMYGYTEAEVVGKPITILVPPELPDEENKILETLKGGGRIEHFETVRVTKTGKRVNVSLSISPIKDLTGATVGISGIARDITERRRAEEALLSSEQRYRLLFEKNVAGVGIASLDGRVLECNDCWARILGYESRDEIRGRLTSEF